MVTVEPWGWDRLADRETLLTDIADGQYDTVIGDICATFASFDHPLFVRWGHEMDTRPDRYAWAGATEDDYINAYRHFVSACRALADNLFYVWSPAGDDDGFDRYFPSRQYADYVGVSTYAFAERELSVHGRIRPFSEIFGEKYAEIQKFDRPVMIAEFGVDGEAAHQRRWVAEALLSLADFPLLRSIVYFNAHDHVDAWEARFAVPDWRISVADFDIARN